NQAVATPPISAVTASASNNDEAVMVSFRRAEAGTIRQGAEGENVKSVSGPDKKSPPVQIAGGGELRGDWRAGGRPDARRRPDWGAIYAAGVVRVLRAAGFLTTLAAFFAAGLPPCLRSSAVMVSTL